MSRLPLKKPSQRIWLLSLLLLTGVLGMPEYARAYGYGTGESSMYFGGRVGANTGYTPPSNTYTFGFGGAVGIGCNGINFGSFMQGFNPQSLVNNIKNNLISGAQAYAENYLLTTIYSNPSLSSVLNMLNSNYEKQFNLFQNSCNAEQDKINGANKGAREMARTNNQCYESQVASGTNPVQAYNYCANQGNALTYAVQNNLPSTQGINTFLNDNVNETIPQTEHTLVTSLLPDQKVGTGGVEYRPPQSTVYQMTSNIQLETEAALEQVLDGSTQRADIPACTATDETTLPSAGYACLPGQAAAVASSPAFMAAQQLSANAQGLYISALSRQIAVAAMRGNILKLSNMVAQLAPKASASSSSTSTTTSAGTKEVIDRMKAMQKQIGRLQQQLNDEQDYANAKAVAARTQILAMTAVNQQNAQPPALVPTQPRGNSFLGGVGAYFGF